jgi:hypothetical protein
VIEQNNLLGRKVRCILAGSDFIVEPFFLDEVCLEVSKLSMYHNVYIFLFH